MIEYERIMEDVLERGDYEVIYDGFETYLTVVIETGVQIKYQFGKIRMDSNSLRISYGIEDYGKSYRWKQNND